MGAMKATFTRDKQYWKFSMYGFLKNLRFFDPYLLLFFREVGISFTLIGVLFSIREISTHILEIPSGVFADSIGRRKSMVICFSGYIVAFLILFLSTRFWMFAIALLFYAVGDAFRTGTHKAMILEHLRIHEMLHLKADYYGHTRSWSQKGSAISSLIAAVIVLFSGGYRMVFLYTIIPYVAGLFLMLSYPKELDFTESTSAAKNHEHLFRNSMKTLSSIITDRALRRSILNFSLFESMFRTSKDYLQPILYQFAVSLPILLVFSDHERSSLIIGLVYFIIFGLSSFASRSAGVFKRRHDGLPRSLNLLYLAGAMCMILAGILYSFEFYGYVVIIFICFYMVQNIRKPLIVDYLSDRIDNSAMATGLSGESQVRTLITAILAPIFGVIADGKGIGTALLIFGIVAVLLLGMFQIRKNEEGVTYG